MKQALSAILIQGIQTCVAVQEQVTGISRDTIPFTTVLVPNPLLTELPNNTQYPLIYNYGRRLLDDAGASRMAWSLQSQHTQAAVKPSLHTLHPCSLQADALSSKRACR